MSKMSISIVKNVAYAIVIFQLKMVCSTQLQIWVICHKLFFVLGIMATGVS
jgi:hypothetical protein